MMPTCRTRIPQENLTLQLTLKIARPPVIQIALDYATIEEALAMAKIGIEAGVDWLEIGTPLIVSQGVAPIGQMVRAFPDYPVLADYKTMDSGWKNVRAHGRAGGTRHDRLRQRARRDGQARRSPKAKNARRLGRGRHDRRQAIRPSGQSSAPSGASHMIYLHYGADQRKADATQDCTQWLAEVQRAVSIPIGVGCFQVEDGARAAGSWGRADRHRPPGD